jgi:hypothetical protein
MLARPNEFALDDEDDLVCNLFLEQDDCIDTLHQADVYECMQGMEEHTSLLLENHMQWHETAETSETPESSATNNHFWESMDNDIPLDEHDLVEWIQTTNLQIDLKAEKVEQPYMSPVTAKTKLDAVWKVESIDSSNVHILVDMMVREKSNVTPSKTRQEFMRALHHLMMIKKDDCPYKIFKKKLGTNFGSTIFRNVVSLVVNHYDEHDDTIHWRFEMCNIVMFLQLLDRWYVEKFGEV